MPHDRVVEAARGARPGPHAPQAVETGLRAGVRSRVALEVGGKSDGLHGTPVALSGRVRTLSDGYFHEPEPRHGSWQNYNQGITAVVETDEDHTILLTSRRLAPMSLNQLLSVGIDPAAKKIIVVKAVIAPWPAYRAVTDRFILCNTAGATETPSKVSACERGATWMLVTSTSRNGACSSSPSHCL